MPNFYLKDGTPSATPIPFASKLDLNNDNVPYKYIIQNRARFTAVPTTAAGAYAAGDVVGTKMTFTDVVRAPAGTGVIESIVINDKANVINNLDIVFFTENPAASTFTDNGAYTVNVADWDKILTFENIDYSCAAAGNRVLKYTPPGGVPFCLTALNELYAVLVCRTAFTLASATDLKVALTILTD